MMMIPFLALAMQTVPLTASDAWAVSYQDAMCILSRPFGDPRNPITVGIRQVPLSDGVEIFILSPFSSKQSATGTISVAFSGSPTILDAVYRSVILASNKQLTTFDIANSALPAFGTAAIVTFTIKGKNTVRIAPTAMMAGLRALADCHTAILRQWHIDPVLEAAAVEPARPSMPPQLWFRDAMTPELRRTSRSGVNVILWSIGLDGKIGDCRIILSSGNKSLDEASCKIVRRNASYRPALDRDGKPVATHATARINWILG